MGTETRASRPKWYKTSLAYADRRSVSCREQKAHRLENIPTIEHENPENQKRTTIPLSSHSSSPPHASRPCPRTPSHQSPTRLELSSDLRTSSDVNDLGRLGVDDGSGRSRRGSNVGRGREAAAATSRRVSDEARAEAGVGRNVGSASRDGVGVDRGVGHGGQGDVLGALSDGRGLGHDGRRRGD